jgi:hypothetical protein
MRGGAVLVFWFCFLQTMNGSLIILLYVVCDFYTEILFFFLMIFCVGLHFLLTVINWRLWRRR